MEGFSEGTFDKFDDVDHDTGTPVKFRDENPADVLQKMDSSKDHDDADKVEYMKSLVIPPEINLPGSNVNDKLEYLQSFVVNKWVRIAADKIGNDIAKLDWRVVDGDGKEIEDPSQSRLLRLLKKPNPNLKTRKFLWYLASDRAIGGESGWEIVEEGKADEEGPGELFLVRKRQDKWCLVPGENQYIKHVEFFTRDKNLDPEDFFRTARPNPMSMLLGLSRVGPTLQDVEQELWMDSWNSSFFKNGALGAPTGVYRSDRAHDKTQRDRWYQEINQRIGNPQNHRGILILPKGLEKADSSTQKRDVHFKDGKKITSEDILIGMGVYPALVGKDVPNGTTLEEQKILYKENTVLPEAQQIQEDINLEFEDLDHRFEFDLEPIKKRINDFQEEREQTREDVKAGIIKRNEARKRLFDKDGVPWGNDWWPGVGQRPSQSENHPANRGQSQSSDGRPDGSGDSTEKGQGIFDDISDDADRRSAIWKQGSGRLKDQLQNKLKEAWLTAFDAIKDQVVERASQFTIQEKREKLEKQGDVESERILSGEEKEIISDQVKPVLEEAVEESRNAAGAAFSVDLENITDVAESFETMAASWEQHRVESLRETMDRRISDTIEELDGQDLSTREKNRVLEQRFDNIVDERIDDLSRSDAETATQEGVKEATDQVDRYTHKMWNTRGDFDVRDNHAEIDQQVVKKGEKFRVPSRTGIDLMEYPGDPAGSPENTSNCRCNSIPITEEEAKRRGAT